MVWTDKTGRGQDIETGISGLWIRITVIVSLGVMGGRKWQLPPISLALKGAWTICVNAEK